MQLRSSLSFQTYGHAQLYALMPCGTVGRHLSAHGSLPVARRHLAAACHALHVSVSWEPVGAPVMMCVCARIAALLQCNANLVDPAALGNYAEAADFALQCSPSMAMLLCAVVPRTPVACSVGPGAAVLYCEVVAVPLTCSAEHSLGGQAVLCYVSSPTMGCRARHSSIDMSTLPSHCSAGHSLGGALAVLAAWDLAPLLPWASLKVYTVGAPRPGNHAFAKVTARLPWQASSGRRLCRAALV